MWLENIYCREMKKCQNLCNFFPFFLFLWCFFCKKNFRLKVRKKKEKVIQMGCLFNDMNINWRGPFYFVFGCNLDGKVKGQYLNQSDSSFGSFKCFCFLF